MTNEKEILTTFEAARYCHVHPGTIKNWIKTANLKAFKTPGGHRRIYKRDLDKFLQDRNIPVSPAENSQRRRVLIVEQDYQVREEITRLLHLWGGMFDVVAVNNAFEGGEMIVVFRPELIVIDPAVCGIPSGELFAHIRSSHYLDGVKILAITGDVSTVRKDGADAVLTRPLEIRKLRREVESFLADPTGK